MFRGVQHSLEELLDAPYRLGEEDNLRVFRDELRLKPGPLQERLLAKLQQAKRHLEAELQSQDADGQGDNKGDSEGGAEEGELATSVWVLRAFRGLGPVPDPERAAAPEDPEADNKEGRGKARGEQARHREEAGLLERFLRLPEEGELEGEEEGLAWLRKLGLPGQPLQALAQVPRAGQSPRRLLSQRRALLLRPQKQPGACWGRQRKEGHQ